MKNLVITFCFLFCSAYLQAQSYEGKNDQKINVGYEFFGYGQGIKASYDHGLNDLFSIGAGTSIYTDKSESDYFVFVRSNLHLGILLDLPCKFDIYPGVELGYLSQEAVGITGYVGFRFIITKKIGIFAELGSTGSAGLTFDV